MTLVNLHSIVVLLKVIYMRSQLQVMNYLHSIVVLLKEK